MKLLKDFLEHTTDLFERSNLYYGHGTDNPWDEAVAIALWALRLPADVGSEALDIELEQDVLKKMESVAKRRIKEKKPLPYLIGEAWYAGERYFVTEDVLIPRSPIAELVNKKFFPYLSVQSPRRILDLCTGSGCIAIHLAKIFTQAQVDAVDISTQALAVAKRNVALHTLQDRVNLIESDMFSNLSDNKYDIIVSNPPYVGGQEMLTLPMEYKHEPELALESKNNGLYHTNIILKRAAEYLTPAGLLVVEVGNSWQLCAKTYPQLAFNWVELENGGHGVFLLQANQLDNI